MTPSSAPIVTNSTAPIAVGMDMAEASTVVTQLPATQAAGLLNGGSAFGGFASASNILGIAGAALPGLNVKELCSSWPWRRWRQPSLDKLQMRELAACRWVAHGDALLLLGPPGVGKTHLAIALGREAIREGYSVLFPAAPALIATLAKAHADGRLEERLAFYAKPKLLIIDELGYLPFEPNAAHLFFQLVSRRYERGSLLITSNRSVGEWGTVFGDPVVATAILDRLLHHSHVVTIRGDSYRLREKRRAGLITAATLTQDQAA